MTKVVPTRGLHRMQDCDAADGRGEDHPLRLLVMCCGHRVLKMLMPDISAVRGLRTEDEGTHKEED